MPSPAIYHNIQCARAPAALAVVAYHMHVPPFGQAGVYVFFAISGVIRLRERRSLRTASERSATE